MSLHSVLRESLIPTTTPLRKKSMLNLSNNDTSLHQNDDDAERMERRRTAEFEMRQHDNVTPSSDKRRSLGGSLAGLSPAQLAEHYANCIKLSAENKINTKNAFSLQLIDYMAMMLKKRDAKMENFQVVSCALDASTKIYAYRVDSVHTDVIKMATGLSVGFSKRNTEVEDGDQNYEEVSSIIRKRRSKKPKTVIASNVETLNAEPHLNCTMDPFFLRSTGNLSDFQPGDCHFLTSLKVNSNCALMLCSDMPYWDRGNDISLGEDPIVSLPPLPDLGDKSICSIYSQFRFTSWSLDAEEGRGDSSGILPMICDGENDFAFDINAVPEPVPVYDACMPDDNFEAPGIDDGLDSDNEEVLAAACGQANENPLARVIDLKKHLATSPSEYSYFRSRALELWAGPSHWKIRHINQTGDREKSATSKNKRKPQEKPYLNINFECLENINVSTASNKSSLELTKRTLSKVWNAERNTYPADLHYDCKQFEQLQIRRLAKVGMHPVPVDDQAPTCDHDTADCCPEVDLGDEMDNDAEGIDNSNDLVVGLHQDVHTNLAVEGMPGTEDFTGDNLVVPPNKVPRIFIPYAQRGKKIDMKKLKSAMWDILVNAEAHKDVTNHRVLRVEKPLKFSYLFNVLPSHLSPELAQTLSAALAMVAVIHLASEKNLHIEGNENLDDLIISQA